MLRIGLGKILLDLTISNLTTKKFRLIRRGGSANEKEAVVNDEGLEI